MVSSIEQPVARITAAAILLIAITSACYIMISEPTEVVEPEIIALVSGLTSASATYLLMSERR